MALKHSGVKLLGDNWTERSKELHLRVVNYHTLGESGTNVPWYKGRIQCQKTLKRAVYRQHDDLSHLKRIFFTHQTRIRHVERRFTQLEPLSVLSDLGSHPATFWYPNKDREALPWETSLVQVATFFVGIFQRTQKISKCFRVLLVIFNVQAISQENETQRNRKKKRN